MSEVTLAQVLQARENRVIQQQHLLQEHQCPLVCFTMNIAGPVKNTPLIQRGFRAGIGLLDQTLPAHSILYRHIESSDTGDTAFYSVRADAAQLKQICIGIEDSTPLGRLFDMDVLDADGAKLERPNQRGCIVCGAPGRACAAGRIHTVTQLQTTTNQILQDHFALADREAIASTAVQSLIKEVNTTPKPGLVDRGNNGSHKDMTIRHFVDSANALYPYFSECVKIGQETANDSPNTTFSRLRCAGIDAEKAMLHATGGVNTHKGAIYTLGVLCGSLGRLWRPDTPVAGIKEILAESALLVQDSVRSDFADMNDTTAGKQLYRKFGIGGIRAEVATGLPSVSEIGLPVYKNALNAGLSPNDAGVIALLHLIASVKDTNLYHRGGVDGAKWAQQAARNLLTQSAYPDLTEIESLDNAFIQRNLSPGGCADLLAVTYFLNAL